MTWEQALDWYRQGRFPADDITRATGLSERSQRELLKTGIVSAVPQAKTKTRLLDTTMLKRAAIIAPLNRAGLSLGVAGRMVYAALMLEDLVFGIVDPFDAYYHDYDPKTGRRTPRAVPHSRDTWFDPVHPPAPAAADFFLAVVNSRFAMLGVDQPQTPYGELTADLSDFVWWQNAMYDEVAEKVRDSGELCLNVGGAIARRPDVLKTIEFRTKRATEEEIAAARMAGEAPVSILTVNASLALRVALRRLLHIDDPARST